METNEENAVNAFGGNMSRKSRGNLAHKIKINPTEQKDSSFDETPTDDLTSLEEIALRLKREGRMPDDKDLEALVRGVMKRARVRESRRPDSKGKKVS